MDPQKALDVFVQMLQYMGDKDYNSTLANVPPAFMCQDGWVPLEAIAGFKRMKALVDSSEGIREALDLIPSNGLFVLSQDGLLIQRTRPFDALEMMQQLSSFILVQHALCVAGFDSLAVAEAQAYFSRFGAVKRVWRVPGCWDPQLTSALMVEFEEYSTILTVLSQPHQYEDCSLQFRIVSPSNHLPAIKLASMPQNRLVEFQLNPLTEIDETKTVSAMIKNAFNNFSSVSTVEFIQNRYIGYVRFKAAVAQEIVRVIQREGGLTILDQPLAIRALSGSEENLVWNVLMATEKPQQASIPPKIHRKPSSRYHSKKNNSRNYKLDECKLTGFPKKASNNKVRKVARTKKGFAKLNDVNAILEAFSKI